MSSTSLDRETFGATLCELHGICIHAFPPPIPGEGIIQSLPREVSSHLAAMGLVQQTLRQLFWHYDSSPTRFEIEVIQDGFNKGACKAIFLAFTGSSGSTCSSRNLNVATRLASFRCALPNDEVTPETSGSAVRSSVIVPELSTSVAVTV